MIMHALVGRDLAYLHEKAQPYGQTLKPWLLVNHFFPHHADRSASFAFDILSVATIFLCILVRYLVLLKRVNMQQGLIHVRIITATQTAWPFDEALPLRYICTSEHTYFEAYVLDEVRMLCIHTLPCTWTGFPVAAMLTTLQCCEQALTALSSYSVNKSPVIIPTANTVIKPEINASSTTLCALPKGHLRAAAWYNGPTCARAWWVLRKARRAVSSAVKTMWHVSHLRPRPPLGPLLKILSTQVNWCYRNRVRNG